MSEPRPDLAFLSADPTFLAPMEGVTHPLLRGLFARRGGISVVCTEFVRVTAQPLGKKALQKHVVRPPRGRLSVQVMGRNIEQMAEATRLVSGAGADVVDINLGCPAPRAVRKGVGSAMLKDLPLLARVLSVMRKSTDLPLSAKIRAGFDDASQVEQLALLVQDCGVDFLTVHPRRRVDFYRGVADWRIIARLAEVLTIAVIGNGDIWYAADALRMQKETGCAGVMIGRPALRNPWIFRQIAALRSHQKPVRPDGSAVVRHLQELTDELRRGYPAVATLGMLKEQMRYLGRTVNDDGAFRKVALRATSAEQLLDLAHQYLAPLGADALDLQAHAGALEQSGSALAAVGHDRAG